MPNSRGRHPKKIDTVHWTVTNAIEMIGLGVGTSAVLMSAAQHLPETLLRIRGEWVASLSGALADGIGVKVAAGMILVPEGTGGTVLWSPVTDGDAPWIWWDVVHLIYREQVADAVSSDLQGVRRTVDSKAMRKVRNTELQFVSERTTITGLTTGNTDVAAQVRALAGS